MRIRSIKPEFWTSDDITTLPYFERLLFIGLWSYVDDNGVGRDEESLIISRIFPADMYRDPRETVASVSRGLKALSDARLIVRYVTPDGRRYLQITGWEHQRIDRPNKPRFPQYQADRDTLATPSRVSREELAAGTGEQGNRGTGEYPPNPPHAGGTEDNPQDTTFELIPAPTTDPDFDDFWATYPKKADRIAAERAWKKAVKRAKPAEIIAGAARYRDDPNRTSQYTKHPATWLNKGSWTNEPIAERRSREVAVRAPSVTLPDDPDMWDQFAREINTPTGGPR